MISGLQILFGRVVISRGMLVAPGQSGQKRHRLGELFLGWHAPLPRPRNRDLAASAMEYEAEYRLVSAICISMHFSASPPGDSCTHFHAPAFACSRFHKTLIPRSQVRSLPGPLKKACSRGSKAMSNFAERSR